MADQSDVLTITMLEMTGSEIELAIPKGVVFVRFHPLNGDVELAAATGGTASAATRYTLLQGLSQDFPIPGREARSFWTNGASGVDLQLVYFYE